MTPLAPTLQAFFTDRLARQQEASPRTVTAYRDTFRLLLAFASSHAGVTPSRLSVEDLPATLILAFLDHLEADRGNTARTRNARLAAIRSLFSYAALRHPEHAAQIQQVLAIPLKRFDKALIAFLTEHEATALINAPDPTRWEGRRDRAVLALAIQAGLRVSELTGLNTSDIRLTAGPHVRCHGKGRKDRTTPLTTETTAVMRTWAAERAGRPGDPLFPTRTGRRLSSDAVQDLVARHTAAAAANCPSLDAKHVTPHVLRHTSAMRLLHAGVDTTVIALWLGHEDVRSTQPYLHADITIKERAIARTAPAGTEPGRYQPPDQLLAFLESL
jgi:site-specific recombinase XerD